MIIRLEPIPLSKVWGGDKLSKIYNIPMDNIGEIWGISAHKSHSNVILNGAFKGMTFRELYMKHREYFGNYSKNEFPLLFKIIDAKADLSVQVHPSDEYALDHENSYGKDECWYILKARKDSKIQIGHSAKSKEEMRYAIKNNNFEKTLNYFKVSNNDYFYIPSGKVHAICKNTTLLEVSQSSDITYRLYDYNRLDNGKLRDLHIDKSLDVISFPDSDLKKSHVEKYFTFSILDIENQKITSDKFGDYLYIIEGEAMINDEKIKKGDFIMISSLNDYFIMGKIKLALIHII